MPPLIRSIYRGEIAGAGQRHGTNAPALPTSVETRGRERRTDAKGVEYKPVAGRADSATVANAAIEAVSPVVPSDAR